MAPIRCKPQVREKVFVVVLFLLIKHLYFQELVSQLTSHPNSLVAPSAERIEEKFGQTTLAYLHDPLFAHAGEKSDIIVANLGHWATGTKFLDQQWSTSKYHDKLRDLVEMVQQRARDLQDLEDEDEDFYSTHRFVDGEYVSGYDDEEEEEEVGHSEDDDEYELEQAREKMRQQRQQNATKENEDLEMYLGDETEEEKVGSRPSRPSRPSEDDHEEYRDYEGRYRDGRYREEGAYGAGRNRYGNNSSNNDHRTPERPRLRFPGSHIFHQSKHPKGHLVDGKDDDSARSSPSSSSDRIGPFREGQDHIEKSADGRYRYGAPKKVVEASDRNNNKKDSAVHHHWTNSGKEEAQPYRSSSENNRSGTRGNSREGDRKGGSRDNKKAGSKTSDDRSRASTYTNDNQGSHASQHSRGYEKTDYRMAKRLTHQRRDDKVDAVSKSRPKYREVFKEETLQMAWVGMVAYPESQPVKDQFFSHDWRTIYRLRYWNQIAEDVMLLHGVRFMDFFSMVGEKMFVLCCLVFFFF